VIRIVVMLVVVVVFVVVVVVVVVVVLVVVLVIAMSMMTLMPLMEKIVSKECYCEECIDANLLHCWRKIMMKCCVVDNVKKS